MSSPGKPIPEDPCRSPLTDSNRRPVSCLPMTPANAIPADLLTPLGAYLRLRGEEGGSFLLESVERGRLGRNSFVGWGARLVSLEEARRSSPCRRLRLVRLRRQARADGADARDGPDFPRAASSSSRRSSASITARESPKSSPASRRTSRAGLRAARHGGGRRWPARTAAPLPVPVALRGHGPDLSGPHPSR